MIGLKGKGWNFNWSDISRSAEIVYKITLGENLQGLIAFFEDPDKQAIHAINAEVAPYNLGSKSQGYVVGPTLFALVAKGARLTMPPKGDTNYTTPSYRIRDMHRWAVANGKDVEKLTPAEREQFIVKPKKQAL